MQYIRLEGVVDDGTGAGPGVPIDTARTLVVPKNSNVTIDVHVVDNAGVEVDLVKSTPAFSAWLTIVKDPACVNGIPEYQIVTSTKVAGTRSTIRYDLPSTAFRTLPAGRYFYDVVLIFNAKRYQIIRVGGFVLETSLRKL